MSASGTVLENLVEIVGGGTPSKKVARYYDGDIPWVTPKDMKSWLITDAIDHISEEAIANSAAKMIPAGAVLVVIRSGVLKHRLPVAVTERPVAINQDMKALLCGDQVHPPYLARFLAASQRVLLLGVRATTADNLPLDLLKRLKVPLPPLPEQRRIAAILDKADAVRRKRQQTLDLADQFLHSAFLDLFGDPVINPKGWPVKKLRGVSDLITDGEHLTPKRTERGVKLLSARNIKDGFVDLEEKVDHISPQEYERLRRRVDPTKGDLLISCSGTIGRVAVLELDEGLALVRSVALVRLKSADMIPQFGAFMLRTPYVQAHMRRGSKASSQANLFQGEIAKLPMLVPPLEVQEKFATLAAQWRTCAEKHQLALVAASTLLASLTQSAFRGDL